MARIVVLGGDGFCGWPTSLHLSRRGHEIIIVDNLSRRKIDVELEVESLTPIRPISERLKAWREISGEEIRYERFTVGENYHRLLTLIREEKPDAVIHFAEQRAAPYSMKSSWHKRYTVNNNLNATNDVLAAIVESGVDVHLVHLGTMGVYGYGTAGMKIPEGYLKVKVGLANGEEIEQEILYPANPGSIYHMTKTQDQLFFYFYNKNDKVKITDLHQGIVWGTQTEETKLDERLINRFDYDGDYGTVLNRFLMQAAIGYPLTVHGTGGQTRAFIHIQDTCRCIELAIENPPQTGERVNILNQMTETHRVRDLAEIVSRLTGTPIEFVKNPRNEADENDLHVINDRFIGFGLDPITLEEGLLREVAEIAGKFAHRCERSKIPCVSLWRRGQASWRCDADFAECEGAQRAPRAETKMSRMAADVDNQPAGDGTGPVVLINVFTPKPAKLDAFIETQKAELNRLAAQRAVKGWRSSRLHRALDGKTAVMVTVFDTIGDHKRWVATAAFAEHLDRIRPLIERAEPGYYQLVAEAAGN